MNEYNKTITNEINDSFRERYALINGIGTSKQEYAEYLKKNFNGQVAEIIEAQKKEENKSKIRKFFDKLIKIL